MEASEAQNPQAPAESPAEAQSPPTFPAEPAPAQDEGGESPTPDVSEQIAALSQEIQGLRTAVQPPEQPQGPLYDQLAGMGMEPEPDYQGEPGYDPYQQGQQAVDEYGNPVEADPYESVIRERVAEATYPILEALEIDRRSGQLDSLAEQYPQLREQETQAAIQQRLAPLAERYGSDLILTDPELVERELVYLAAQKTNASEVPAAEAATQGATLETGVGAAGTSSDVTPEEAIKQGIMGAGPGGNAFV